MALHFVDVHANMVSFPVNSGSKYFKILDDSESCVGIVIMSPNDDNGYDYKFYAPSLTNPVKAKISWLIAIHESYPSLVEI